MTTQPDEGHYPEFDQVVAEARRRARGFVDPAGIRATETLTHRRGSEWCTAVIGREYRGLRYVSSWEAHMLDVADEMNLDPPLSPATLAARQAAAEHRRIEGEHRLRIEERRARAWDDARAACTVPVEVRPNVNSGIHGNRREALRHVVPLDDATGRRAHPAGRSLCDAGRARPMVLGEPTTEPATCTRCVAATSGLRPLSSVPPTN